MVPLKSMTRPRIESQPLTPLDAYLLAVTLTGAALLAVTAGYGAPEFLPSAPASFWAFAFLVLVGQMLRIKVRGYDEITSATSFLFALLLLFGLDAALVALAVSVVVSAARNDRSVLQSGFTLGQQTIALSLAGAVLVALTDLPRPDASPPIAPYEVAGLFVAGGVWFVTTNLLAQVLPALIEGESWRALMGRDLSLQMLTAAVFISLAPIILLAAHVDLSLCLLLLLPMIAIYKGGKEAVMNEHRALHDLLTGLPNRTLFTDRIEQAVKLAQRNAGSVSVLFLDLDHFKEINDTLGHHQGDMVLRTLGPRLEEVLRETDTVAHLGGDEFGILLPEAHPAEAARVASKILEALKRPLNAEALTLQVGASIGIATFPAHGEDTGTLLQHADVAMFYAKKSRNGYELYRGGEDAVNEQRVLLASDLREAVASDQFTLAYQPLIDLPTRKVTSVEVLARWQHPARGVVSPAEFIPLAEHIGVIRPLTISLLEKAARDWHRFRAAGHDLTLAVNFSARHLMSRDFADEVAELLKESGLPASRLTMEITETTLLSDPRHGEEVLDALSATGVRIAVDDFGTGYSSLSYLKRLPVDELKIDRSFVSDMLRSENSETIVRSIVQLGHNLNLEVIAEGVEDERTLAALREMGCDGAQGFLVSSPLDAQDLSRWVSTEAHLKTPV